MKVFGTHDPATLAQLEDVRSRAADAALMADGHVGYVMPIGGVAAYRDQVSVVGVGFDIAWVILALLTPGVLYLARRFSIERDRWRSALPAHLVGATAFALVHLGGTATFYALVDRSLKELPLLLNKFISAYFILDVLVYCGIVGASHALHYYREAEARELATSRLQESLTQTRLAALRGQLNPHFLFNTLNAISTMPGARHT